MVRQVLSIGYLFNIRRTGLQLFFLGAILVVVGAAIAFAVWRVGGIVILMVGAALLTAARFMMTGDR